ncbi:MAG: acyloxyacyl hydrolase [Massilibacteroides sp.]|nr:acyloxyacyl hydrolase [Massilibacteroides sp.]MDD3062099.1 acyloxyacyl hydrolase [Massilibacteroides sp.]MDD4114077.1 acyloxyacyl hydrolase [Massilibacteroides sp.]MDD4659643.1 acyloxyacyl hydrolase [Massilibacteroides sp.]
MKGNRGRGGITLILGLLFLFFSLAEAEELVDEPESKDGTKVKSSGIPADKLIVREDSLFYSRSFIHQLGVEVRPGYILPTNSFLRGENLMGERITNSFSAHLKYSFKSQPNTCSDWIYGGAYQGIGFSYFSYGEPEQLGNPFAFYLFQGARIARLNPRLSLNYEWNFGLSGGWKPYDYDENSYNKVIGSEVNAYMNVSLYFNWVLSRQFDLMTGLDLTHFSNGNTKFPNAGLNTTGFKMGLVYNFNREQDCLPELLTHLPIPEFTKHVSYDLVLFGSWRRKGVQFGDEQVASPDAYTVLGFNFAPMYNFGYKLRAGVSLDGVYDGSANVYTEDYIVGTEQQFYKPSLSRQLALGLSGRIEYIMPFFSVNIGLGVNVLHRGGDLRSFYQVLALKTDITRNTYIHIGYCLENFHNPNYLMLGIGFRFHNRYPIFHH